MKLYKVKYKIIYIIKNHIQNKMKNYTCKIHKTNKQTNKLAYLSSLIQVLYNCFRFHFTEIIQSIHNKKKKCAMTVTVEYD